VTSLEIKFKNGAKESVVQKDVTKIFGKGFIVQNKYEQQEIFYKVMQSERFAIFFILTLILIIASFSIIGSLTMLIIEKERDIEILRSLGADNTLIRKIFIFEGWLISIIGALAGILLGFAVCWIQQKYGLIRLQSDSLMVNAYPVVMKIRDFIIVPVTVLLIGFWAAWYPVRFLTKKYLTRN
jgi:ABC-type lipoprotein release transport system permease subunit